MTIRSLALAVVLGLMTSPPTWAAETTLSASAWVLALPPLKGSGAAGAQAGTPSRDSVWRQIVDSLDRDAPVSAWAREEVFDKGEACEDARLAHLAEFGEAIDRATSAGSAAPAREPLSRLAQRAFARCVPAFAFSDSTATSR